MKAVYQYKPKRVEAAALFVYLLPSRNNKAANAAKSLIYGALGRIRTYDRSVRSRVLYPAELRVR